MSIIGAYEYTVSITLVLENPTKWLTLKEAFQLMLQKGWVQQELNALYCSGGSEGEEEGREGKRKRGALWYLATFPKETNSHDFCLLLVLLFIFFMTNPHGKGAICKNIRQPNPVS